MQEHAEDIHSRVSPRCPQCAGPLQVGDSVCPACGARVPTGLVGGAAVSDRTKAEPVSDRE